MSDVTTAALVTKYLSAAGLGVLLYDHLLTFSSEVSLVWPSPPSFSKYIFLINRYLVPIGILLTACQMNGTSLTSTECRIILPIAAVMALTSLGVAEILVLLRVVVLWDRNLRVACLMISGFTINFSATVIFIILALVKLIDHIDFSPPVSMCVLTTTSPFLVAAWSFPILFECIVLVSTAYNALSQPRTAKLPLTRTLHRDGIAFFLALTVLRIMNFSFAATFRPEFALMGVFFVWPMTSVLVNRSLFRIRHAKILDDELQREGLLENIDASSRPSSPHGYQLKG